MPIPLTTRLPRTPTHLLSVPGKDPEGEARPTLGPRQVFMVSVWLGLLIGLAELGLRLAIKPIFDSSPGLFRMNRQMLWVVPTVDLCLFAGLGLVLAVMARFRPAYRPRILLGPLCMLALMVLTLCAQRLHVVACAVLALGIGARLAFRLEPRVNGLTALCRRTTPWLGLVAGVLAAASIGREVARERWVIDVTPTVASTGPAAPSVLLIVLDTVRADHLSLYGYARATTPNLQRLANRGVTFRRAWSTAPWTLPSHASMMNGRWPHEHKANGDRPIDGSFPTLADYLGANGYATAGFVANTTYGGAETGLAQGFARYDDHDLSPASLVFTTLFGRKVICPILMPQEPRAGGHPLAYRRKEAGRIRGDLLDWLDRQEEGRPFFAFLNLFDAHNPYITPEGFRRRFMKHELSVADLRTLDRWFILDKDHLAPDDAALAIDSYDDCLAYLDEQLGRLFEDLERRGRLDNTLVIVTADHGEHLGEHHLYGHASSLYDQELHVPLVVFPPRGRGAGMTVAEPISLRDLPATVVDVLGLAGRSPFPGRSIARYWAGDGATGSVPTLAEVDAPKNAGPNLGRSPAFRGSMKAVTDGRRTYIRNSDGREELYDVETDPGETRDLAGDSGSWPILEAFRDHLFRLLSASPTEQGATE